MRDLQKSFASTKVRNPYRDIPILYRQIFTPNIEIRQPRRRYRSSDPGLRRIRNEPPTNVQRRSRPTSASSMDSVVYLGTYRKVPQQVMLDSSDDEKPPERATYRRKKVRKLRSAAKAPSVEPHSKEYLNAMQRN